MATIKNARDVALQATSPRITTVSLPGNVTLPWSQIPAGGGRPADNADVTVTAVNGGLSVTGGGITLSSGGSIKGGQTAYATGTGFFLGYSSSNYRLSIGSSTKYLRWDGSSLSLRGDITGDSSIDITGSANFGGQISDGTNTAAVLANESRGADMGVIGLPGPGGAGCAGLGTHSGTYGISGVSLTAGAIGVGASELAGAGLALEVGGEMTISNSSLVTNLNSQYWNSATRGAPGQTGAAAATFPANNKPGSGTTNTWMSIVVSGVTYYIPVWQ